MIDWQPPKTAPKDGVTYICVWDDVERYLVPDVIWDGDNWISEGTPWSGSFSGWFIPHPPKGDPQ